MSKSIEAAGREFRDWLDGFPLTKSSKDLIGRKADEIYGPHLVGAGVGELTARVEKWRKRADEAQDLSNRGYQELNAAYDGESKAMNHCADDLEQFLSTLSKPTAKPAEGGEVGMVEGRQCHFAEFKTGLPVAETVIVITDGKTEPINYLRDDGRWWPTWRMCDAYANKEYALEFLHAKGGAS